MIKKIEIAKKMHPFSHRAGTEYVLAGSTHAVKVFPCRLEFRDLAEPQKGKKALSLSLLGPVQKFTVIQNIEKQILSVFGHYTEGYVHYDFIFEDKNLHILLRKGPKEGITMQVEGDASFILKPKNSYLLFQNIQGPSAAILEKLSLGCHKALDWELVSRRKDLKELFPIWFQLGQTLKYCEERDAIPSTSLGNGYLLEKCHELITHKKREELEEAFLSLFLSGFSGVFVPSLVDVAFQGLLPISEEKGDLRGTSALFLLSKGANLIRKCFIAQPTLEILSILPCLPVSFHEGRLTQIHLEGVGEVDMEWSKKILRRMELRVNTDAKIRLDLQSQIKTFRIRTSSNDRGKKMGREDLLTLEKGKKYFLDRFEK